ncbi:hypothetical protein HYE02_02790 [Mycoplasmopsis bovis]|nr:hypothetical protein [Mycoplasmopsis bovis]QQH28321.1 hypothetical protein HYE02_02790 [Mycoplasmopsis bovis]
MPYKSNGKYGSRTTVKALDKEKDNRQTFNTDRAVSINYKTKWQMIMKWTLDNWF